MTQQSDNTKANTNAEKLGVFPFVVGGMSFIPLLGVVFGLIALVWGLVSAKRGGKLLAAMGAAGIAFTVLLYSALFYFGFAQRGGVYDDLRGQMAQNNLDSLVSTIESYQVQHGQYPASLAALQDTLPQERSIILFDPLTSAISGQPEYFFYQRVGERQYHLRSLGADDKPFTDDDIVPHMPAQNGGNSGLLRDATAP